MDVQIHDLEAERNSCGIMITLFWDIWPSMAVLDILGIYGYLPWNSVPGETVRGGAATSAGFSKAPSEKLSRKTRPRIERVDKHKSLVGDWKHPIFKVSMFHWKP